MKVLEILAPIPRAGMDLDELERAIRKHSVKACVTMTNCHNLWDTFCRTNTSGTW